VRHKQAHPYVYLDAKDNGANVSRINFAPKKINGVDTNFQNSAIRRLCQPPYFEFYALRDIRAVKSSGRAMDRTTTTTALCMPPR